MKKTSLMQKMHSLLSSKAWRNGLTLLLLLCFVGTTQVSAQSLNTGMEQNESEFVTSSEALKLLQAKKTEFETTVKAANLTDAEYAKWKFYAYVGADIQNGQTVEDALENADSKLTQKALQLGTFTMANVNAITEEVTDYLRN
jgi:hypothetical protein